MQHGACLVVVEVTYVAWGADGRFIGRPTISTRPASEFRQLAELTRLRVVLVNCEPVTYRRMITFDPRERIAYRSLASLAARLMQPSRSD